MYRFARFSGATKGRRSFQTLRTILVSFALFTAPMGGIWGQVKGYQARTPPVSGNPQIGLVKSIQGNWCRPVGSSPLRKNDLVFWNDDIHYCNSSIQVVGDQIVIAFDKTPPYEQAYECSTPGLCDQNQNLWIKGAFRYGRLPQTAPSTLISAPPLRSSVLPDTVIPEGNNWPDKLVTSAASGTYTICAIEGDQPMNCVKTTPSKSLAPPVTKPGLYAIYTLDSPKGWLGSFGIGKMKPSPTKPPAALVVVTRTGSFVPQAWNSFSAAYHLTSDPQLVEERRSYLLDLYTYEGSALKDESSK